MYGPIVLAGKLGTAGLTAENLRAEPTKPRTVPEYKSEPVAAPSIRAASADPASLKWAFNGPCPPTKSGCTPKSPLNPPHKCVLRE